MMIVEARRTTSYHFLDGFMVQWSKTSLTAHKALIRTPIEYMKLVVESSCDSAASLDRDALSAYQYFENARNFLVAVEQMRLHTFEASDLEQVSV
ncbi:putative minus-end-directed kinesin ATPase [Helianthus annuus]|nr:putative minus-end-directed kinesin ATPase [Helianthus annuus]